MRYEDLRCRSPLIDSFSSSQSRIVRWYLFSLWQLYLLDHAVLQCRDVRLSNRHKLGRRQHDVCGDWLTREAFLCCVRVCVCVEGIVDARCLRNDGIW